jgi:hypothetical protein
MSDKPRSFKEVVAAQNPAERARMENRETFNDVMVRNPSPGGIRPRGPRRHRRVARRILR